MFHPDTILHPNIEGIISDFISKDGNIPQMISELVDNYRGYLHLIDALGTVTNSLGGNFKEDFEDFLISNILSCFNSNVSNEKFNENNPPDWINDFLENDFMFKLVLALIEKFSNSNLLKYMFDNICKNKPSSVSNFPKCLCKYDCFISVLKARYFLLCNHVDVSENQAFLLNLFITDDLTLFYIAQHIDTNKNIKLINKIQKLLEPNQEMLKYFKLILLKLEKCDESLIDILLNHNEIKSEMINVILEVNDPSNFLKEIIISRLNNQIFNRNLSKEMVLKIIHMLIKLTNSNANNYFILTAIQYIKEWKLDLTCYLTYVLYSIQFHFFSEALMPVLRNYVIKSSAHPSRSHNIASPIKQILCEIAFHHKDLIPQILEMIKYGVKSKREFPTYSDLLSDLFDVLSFIFFLGDYSLDVIKIFADKSDNDTTKRNPFISILRSVRPPYSKEFLHEMLLCISSPNINSLFFPKEKKIAGMNVKPLEALLYFLEQLNRDENTETFKNDAYIFDNIRREARRITEIAKNKTQHTLNCYF